MSKQAKTWATPNRSGWHWVRLLTDTGVRITPAMVTISKTGKICASLLGEAKARPINDRLFEDARWVEGADPWEVPQ